MPAQVITMEELLTIVRGGSIESAPQGGSYTLADGTKHNGYPPNSGGFVGRAGSFNRNRKGRSVRQPNGSRTYLNTGNVVMYTPRPCVC